MYDGKGIHTCVLTAIMRTPHALTTLHAGVCNLCNAAVRFIIKRDPKRNLLFCSAQSPKAEPYLRG